MFKAVRFDNVKALEILEKYVRENNISKEDIIQITQLDYCIYTLFYDDHSSDEELN